MIADLVCNCTRWFKQSSWPTPRFYTVTLLWKLGRIIVPLGKKNKTVQTLILLLVDSVISFPSVATIYRKGETTGQLEIHVDVNSFSSPPTPLQPPPPPHSFSCCTNYRSTPLWRGEPGFGAEGEEISLVLNQTTSSILPPHAPLLLFPVSLSLPP